MGKLIAAAALPDAPTSVKYASLLLWAVTLLSLFELPFLFSDLDPITAEIDSWMQGVLLVLTGLNGLFFVVYGLLIYFASRKKNWARWALLIWLIVGAVVIFVLVLVFPPEQPEPLLTTLFDCLLTIIEALGTCLLFTKAATNWYRQSA